VSRRSEGTPASAQESHPGTTPHGDAEYLANAMPATCRWIEYKIICNLNYFLKGGF
jgi:hypothetical protein